MNRKKLLLGNWKMNLNLTETLAYAKVLNQLWESEGQWNNQLFNIDFGVAPSFLHLHMFKSQLPSDAKVIVAAQDGNVNDAGAYTSGVSLKQLSDDQIEYVLLGHSERRVVFHDTDEMINAKVLKALELGMKVVLCFGENLEQYENNETNTVLEEQVKSALNNVAEEHMENVVLAYEPVWAIGTGKTATAEYAQNTIKYVRDEVLAQLYNENVANNTLILYGGSVNTNNVVELCSQADVDGALVGGASLKADSFVEMAKLLSTVQE